jgi:predicted TIM-barrel fold metal-dependent hydrolase
MARMCKAIGAGRMIFSSNHPVSRMSLEVEKVRDLDAPLADKTAILGGNIQRLLNLRGGLA